MFHRYSLYRYCVRVVSRLPLLLLLLLPGCSEKNTPEESTQEQTPQASGETLILSTDTVDWYIAIFYTGMLYAEASAVTLPEQWHIPSKPEATVLKSLEYPHSERFITSDGYTFAMPSASVTKAGQKTKYSVLGLRYKYTVINITF